MWIIEVMLAVFIGTITFVICHATNNRPLATMAKMFTFFICLDILIRVFVPVFYTIKKDVEEFKTQVDSIEKKIDNVQNYPENLLKDKKGWFWDVVDEQLNGPERRGEEKVTKKGVKEK